jgi:hypothetical protein
MPGSLDGQWHFLHATADLSIKSKLHRNFVMSGEADYGFHAAPRQKISTRSRRISPCTLKGFV